MTSNQVAGVGRGVPSAPQPRPGALDTYIRKSVIFAQIFCANTEERRTGDSAPYRVHEISRLGPPFADGGQDIADCLILGLCTLVAFAVEANADRVRGQTA